jgi:hypothetical protein
MKFHFNYDIIQARKNHPLGWENLLIQVMNKITQKLKN